jgi:tRNA threonylcarbamoyladenosine biosynthesis protein TsaB
LALRLDGNTVSAYLGERRAHASDMLPRLQALLRDIGFEGQGLPRLDGIIVGTGPGSYTGLRVGIATALGLARASDAPLRGVPSFEALALAELEPGQVGSIALDARAGRFYFARYRRTEEDVTALIEPRTARAAELATLLSEDDTILGEEKLADAAGLPPAIATRVRTGAVPQARALLTLGARRLDRLGAQSADQVQPLYLRAFGES